MNSDDIKIGAYFLLYMFGAFYFQVILSTAPEERWSKVAKVKLPRWIRIILFLNAPNPYKRGTVIEQMVNFTMIIISLVVILFF